jgi:2-amino-4-hydroxy-6-hydroxymethyldihydropteridine diphosphokinase
MSPSAAPATAARYPGRPKKKRELHPIVRAAVDGELPEWTRAGRRRREHMARVSELLREWARAAGEKGVEVARWTAVGLLHDVLREARGSELRPLLPPAFRDAPKNLLHGPAAAFYLEREGVRDYEFLDAIRYHTIGHPGMGRLGRALFAADFLEPGRKLRPRFRARLRERMPDDLDAVVREILGARIQVLVDADSGIRPETVNFWNVLVDGSKRK